MKPLDHAALEEEAYMMAQTIFETCNKMHEQKGRNFLKFIEGLEAYEVTSMVGAFLICMTASGISDEEYRNSMIADRFELVKYHLPRLLETFASIGVKPDIGPHTEN